MSNEDQRSNIDNTLIDEVIKSNGTVRNRNGQLKGLQQYQTPPVFARQCMERLLSMLHHQPQSLTPSIYDPQCAGGNLVRAAGHHFYRFGIELDPSKKPEGTYCIHGPTVKAVETIKDVARAKLGYIHHPLDVHFDLTVANPPFGLRWPTIEGGRIDSSKWTLDHCMEWGNAGLFISNADTIKRHGWQRHPWVLNFEEYKSLWAGVDVTAGVIYWERPANMLKHSVPTRQLELLWSGAKHYVSEELEAPKHGFNFWLDQWGRIKTYLSTRTQKERKLTGKELEDLLALEGNTPMSLTGDFKARRTMQSLVAEGFYRIERACEQAIREAVTAAFDSDCPIMTPTDFEMVAYAEENGRVCCRNTHLGFTPGKWYEVESQTYKFKSFFDREKIHLDEGSLKTYTMPHRIELTGTDRKLLIRDDNGKIHEFLDREDPDGGELNYKHPESELWLIFDKPEVKTVAERFPDNLTAHYEILSMLETLGNFTYKPGQKDYIARTSIKDHGLPAAQTGCGKTLMAISLAQLKGAQHTLIIAPQGTTRDSVDASTGKRSTAQWIDEIHRFAPWAKVFPFFCLEDLESYRQSDGSLPRGYYITYYEAMFRNGAREFAPKSWKNKHLWPLMGKAYSPDIVERENEFGKKEIVDLNGGNDTYLIEGMGDCGRVHGKEHSRGIKCVAMPCLAELIGHEFDMVLADEGHKACNLNAQLTDALIRLQPKWRYVFTATPIPNIASNLFSLMGWLCVPDWYKGGNCNAIWPYRREDGGRFCDNFLSHERDHTAEDLAFRKTQKRQKVKKASPIISSPARLLKILKPTLAYITKPECNPDYRPPEIIDVRVHMGLQQGKLYAHYMERANVPHDNPLVRAALQLTILRGLCAEPMSSPYNRKLGEYVVASAKVTSPYNPKLQMILGLARDIFREGRQVVIVNSRVDLTDLIERKLNEAGVQCSRIDTTVSSKRHAGMAAEFKRGDTRVMLMGIKCAQAYSFDQCDRLIIGSLEYSYGTFEQAKGRIDRLMSRGTKIYCVLVKDSIEETVFDSVATKQDNATICLKGKRVPRDFKPVDEGELLAESFNKWSNKKLGQLEDEAEASQHWPQLCASIRDAYYVLPQEAETLTA